MDSEKKPGETGAQGRADMKGAPRQPVTIDLKAERINEPARPSDTKREASGAGPAAGSPATGSPAAASPVGGAGAKPADAPKAAGAQPSGASPSTAAQSSSAAAAAPAGAAPGPASSAASSSAASHAAAAKPAEQPRPSVASPEPAAAATGGGAGASAAQAARSVFDDGGRKALIAGLAGGIIALVLVIVLQGLSLLPVPGRAQALRAAEQAEAVSQSVSALERRLTALEAMAEGLPSARADAKAASDRLDALETAARSFAPAAGLEALSADIASLRAAVSGVPAGASPDELALLAERVSRMEVAIASGAAGSSADAEAAIQSLTGQIGSTSSAMQALRDRLEAAEEKLAGLEEARAGAGGDAAMRAVAVTALRRAASGPAPFLTELDMAASLGMAGDAVGALRPYAERGVKTASSLSAEFPAVADAILAAARAPAADAGIVDRLLNGLGSLVTVRPAGPIPGSDPQAVVSRMVAAARANDLRTILTERAALPEIAQAASAAWAGEAQDRVAVDDLVEQVASAADGSGG